MLLRQPQFQKHLEKPSESDYIRYNWNDMVNFIGVSK